MGFLGFGRSALKSPDARVREAAVRDLPLEQQGRLAALAEGDPDAGVRAAAAAKVQDLERLERLVRHSDEQVVAIARRKLAARAVDEAKRLPADRARIYLEQITEQAGLVELALRATDPGVRDAAFGKLLRLDRPSQTLLATVAIQEETGRFGRQALDHIDERQVLKDIARKAKDAGLRALAEARIAAIDAEREKPSREKQRKAREQALAPLLDEARALGVASDPAAADDRCGVLIGEVESVIARWPEVADEPACAQARQTLERLREQIRRRRAQAAEAARQAAERRAARSAALSSWRERAAVVADEGREALLDAFRAANPGPEAETALETERRAIEAMMTGRPAVPVETPAEVVAAAPVAVPPEISARIEALLAKARELAASDRFRDAEAGFMALDKEWRTLVVHLGPADERRGAFAAIWSGFKDRRRETRSLRAQQVGERLTTMKSLLVEAEALAAVKPDETGLDAHHQTLRDLQARWKALGPVPPAEAAPLREAFRAACDIAYAPVRARFEARDWERFARVPAAEALITEAQALAAREGEAGADLAAAVKDLQTRWKEVGPLPREKQEGLYQSFKTACDVVYEKLKPHFAARDAERAANLERKLAIIADLQVQVEDAPHGVGSPADPEAERARTAKVKAIQEAWKAVGPVPREQDQEVYGRYRTLLDRFYASRRALHAALDQERAENLVRKQAICERIEALATSVETFAGGQRVGAKREADFLAEKREIDGDWRSVGHVPRESMDAIRARFGAASDRIRTALAPWFAKEDEERRQNLEKKQALLAELTALLDEPHPEYFRAEVRAIQDRWREIGHVPREHMDINQTFIATVRRVLDATARSDDGPAPAAAGDEQLVTYGAPVASAPGEQQDQPAQGEQAQDQQRPEV